MEDVFEFADAPYNLRNQSKCSRSLPYTYALRGMALKRHLLWVYKVPTEIIIPNLLRNLKHELRVEFPKTVLARYVNCSLNI